MKDLLKKIKKIREKTVTAACRTPDGIEWTTLKISQDNTETVHQEHLPMEFPVNVTPEELANLELPDLSEYIKGDVTVALRSSDLLMRTMKLPTADPEEIADMVGFQVDKFSPFPIDQLAMAHETLSISEDSAQVLMAAAKRERIDAVGDSFETKGLRIHSIDARALGWLQLLQDEGKLSGSACEILVLVDGIDFILLVLSKGIPIAFRPLEAQLDDMTVVDELTHEIGYTLTTLDAEHDLPTPDSICFWSIGGVPAQLQAKLAEKCGLEVEYRYLGELPPLSEGILRRARNEQHHIELIPREWIEHQQRLKLRKQFTIISGSVAAAWLLLLLIFLSVFKVRDIQLASVKDDANAIAPLARQAAANQKKLKALKVYTDRTDSSIECMREITRLMPAGDIEFLSYNYSKDKGITLRGSGRDKSIVNDLFTSLNKSPLFDGIKNESVNDKTTKGVRRAVFSVTLPLAAKGDD
ncbi:pilus assembly protein PilM [Pontiellaceae bacterium B12227]|nr:pilus assembly protein PilM [Pontiellaceae bacterium B12227]